MFKKKKGLKKLIVTSLASVMVLGSVSFAAAKIYTEKIDVTYGRMKINYNGNDVTTQVEQKYGTKPFVENKSGRSYVPVRALADVLGVNVRWDAASNTAFLTGGGNTAFLEQQIVNLRAENDLLRTKLKDQESGSSDKSIRDIEKQLIKDYETYEKVSFSIRLKGDDRRADLEVDVDLSNRRDKDAWDDLSERNVERFIEKMVDDIQREYRDCNVKGYIRDSDAREDLYTFEKDGTRSIKITREKGSSSSNLKDIEDRLDNKYSDGLDKIKRMSFSLSEGKKDRYDLTVELDYDKYESEWDKLADSEIKSFMKDIRSYASDRLDERKPEINVEIKDGRKTLATYSYDDDFNRKY